MKPFEIGHFVKICTLTPFSNYIVNSLGQRTSVATDGTAFTTTAPQWSWQYNSRGELEQANDTSAANRDRAYQYDSIGNREKTVNGLLGDLPSSPNYAANAVNQYTTANGITLPDPAYDHDGNLTSGPLPVDQTSNAALLWDAENRLVKVAKANGDVIAIFDYDYLGRRIAKTAWTGGSAGPTTIYLYDGFNCIAEYTGTTPALAKTYTWGIDLSGSMQGAGGVGGLLSVASGSVVHYPTYDGNGNISEYLPASGVVPAAHFEYDPFGNAVVNSDTAGLFTYRFSTKPLDFETGLYYYTYRYYDPATGRWLSRDPIGERGGLNIYIFNGNDGLVRIDLLGLAYKVTRIPFGNCGCELIVLEGTVKLDTDGTGPDHGDPTHQDETSYKPGGKSMNADEDAYVVAPKELAKANGGPIPRGALVLAEANGNSVAAVVGDFGPNKEAGEISMKTAEELGIPTIDAVTYKKSDKEKKNPIPIGPVPDSKREIPITITIYVCP